MARRGILSYGSVINDVNVVVDRYPSEDGVAIVLDRSWSTGGPAYNAPATLRRLDPGFPAEIQSLIGDDSNGAVVRRSLEQAGIEDRRMQWTREAEQCHTEVMSSQASGRRTFFVARVPRSRRRDFSPVRWTPSGAGLQSALEIAGDRGRFRLDQSRLTPGRLKLGRRSGGLLSETSWRRFRVIFQQPVMSLI